MRGTLTSKHDIELLFESGIVGRTQILTVLARPAVETDPHGRIVVVAGRGIGSAVRRNRAKRIMREAVRRVGGPWPGYHVAIIARRGLLEARFDQVEDALRRALTQAGVVG